DSRPRHARAPLRDARRARGVDHRGPDRRARKASVAVLPATVARRRGRGAGVGGRVDRAAEPHPDPDAGARQEVEAVTAARRVRVRENVRLTAPGLPRSHALRRINPTSFPSGPEIANVRVMHSSTISGWIATIAKKTAM